MSLSRRLILRAAWSVLLLGAIGPWSFGQSVVHFVIVADTDAAGIGQFVPQNVKLVDAMLDALQHNPQVKVQRHLLDGQNVRSEIVMKFVLGLQGVGPNDSLVVYYAGHGSTTLWNNSVTHILNMTHGDLPRPLLFSAMYEKNAGKTVLITDACSSLLLNPGQAFIANVPHFNTASMMLLQSLFVHRPGDEPLCVSVTGATFDQVAPQNSFAWFTPQGGLFTKALVETALQPPPPLVFPGVNWQSFMGEVRPRVQNDFIRTKAAVLAGPPQQTWNIMQAQNDQTPNMTVYNSRGQLKGQTIPLQVLLGMNYPQGRLR